MNIRERQHLEAEISELNWLIDQTPKTDVIDRMSLESRKEEVEAELASLPEPTREPARVSLTFRGKPTVGSYGIFADFGASAVKGFVDAVTAIGASHIAPLGHRGALRNRDEFQLLITGTALGSFGFELEEAPREETRLPEMSPIELAIDQVKAIMKASVGNDEELSEAISDTDPRALSALRSFFKHMADHEAICALEFKDDVFRFVDAEQLRRSEARLSQDNIHEENRDIDGQFLGVLPEGRTFEFQIEESAEIIRGKVGPLIEDAGIINKILGTTTRIKVQTKRVGESRPRYVLLSYEEPHAEVGSATDSLT